MPVAHDDVLHPDLQQDLGRADPRRTAPIDDNLERTRRLVDDFQRVEHAGQHTNRHRLAVIVDHRNVHRALQLFADREARRCDDVFEADAAERRRQFDHRLDDLADVVGAQADRQRIDAGECLEDDALPFHHRQDRLGPDPAETEGRRSVGHDGNRIAAHRLRERLARVLRDVEAGLGHAGRVHGAEDAGVRNADLGGHPDQSGLLLPVGHRLTERPFAAGTG